jgi:hypothetical protein
MTDDPAPTLSAAPLAPVGERIDVVNPRQIRQLGQNRPSNQR